MKKILPVAAALALSACGGGGAPAVPTLAVQLNAAGATQQVVEGTTEVDLTVTATYSGSSNKAIVPEFQFDASLFAQQGEVAVPQTGTYVLRLRTRPNLAVNNYSGQIGIRLCQESACATVYPGSTQKVSYAVKVALADWNTFQRNSAHNAYVHVTLDPSKFSKAWTWSRPSGDSEPVGGINTVSTGQGMVFVSKDIYFGQAEVFALKESDGGQVWHYASGYSASEGPPAYADGSVYFGTTTSSQASRVTALDAATGTFKFNMPFSAQWPGYFAPTIYGGAVLNTSGSLTSYSVQDGKQNWRSGTLGTYDFTSPAADSKYVYQYGSSSGKMSVLDRATGTTIASITDPFNPGSSGYSEFSAPMLGSVQNVIAFSGGGFSGRAASNSEQYESRVLVNYDVNKQAVAWRTQGTYLTHPALGNGVIYAASSTQLDAISEVDGKVQWSWPLPAGDASFHRNGVVTDNLIFVSTDTTVYAIDLKTHQSVWKYPAPGNLAISGGGILYITTGARESDGKLVAIKLM
ncbi:PQQ-binding-like beta-propeller repeat protein [Pseudoduganella sp. FT55W]|uniref:PQQ-binding-like beta-propeller repeat protein n=1 Tax=Duganella rivi TaxID=2666083 RepID=A0A7X4KEA6_9BURK|nr:PQQ-binding-like beta-propeller repeat protein [Duganella rivi]MYM69278.1 PQQ-binding-like beta-propeller repeat protein [Duganella rivi]